MGKLARLGPSSLIIGPKSDSCITISLTVRVSSGGRGGREGGSLIPHPCPPSPQKREGKRKEKERDREVGKLEHVLRYT